MIRLLLSGYRAEIDTLQGAAWHECVATFSDANVYQLWQRDSVSRLLVNKSDDLVAAAEVRLFLVPFTRRGVAYIRWGPLWRRIDRAPDPGHFRQVIRALR